MQDYFICEYHNIIMFQVSYSKTLTSIGTFGGTMKFQNPRNINTNQHWSVRLQRTTISTSIPNVFQYNGINTGLIRVSNDDGATHTDIQLENGNYSVSQINSAVNATVSSWWKTSGDWGIQIKVNEALRRVYLVIDSTKLVDPGQIVVDFSRSNVDQLLGIGSTKVFDADGVYEFTEYPKIDWFGNAAYISITGIGSLSYVNGLSSYIIGAIDFIDGSNQYVFVNNSPNFVSCDLPSYWSSFSVDFLDRNGTSIVGFDGTAEVILEFRPSM
jgi:hypothetical protein